MISVKKACVLVLALLLAGACVFPAFADPIFSEDFSQNAALDGWALYQWDPSATGSRALLADDTIGTMAVVSDDEYGQVLRVEDKAGDKIVRAERTISDPVLNGKYVIEYDIKPEEGSIVVLGNGEKKYTADANSYFLHIHHTGKLVEIRGSKICKSENIYSLSEWHHVKIIMNIAGRTADVFVDDVRVGEQVGYRYSGVAPVDTVAVGSAFTTNDRQPVTLFANLTVSPAAAATFPADASLTVSRNFGDTLDLSWTAAEGHVKYRLYQDGEELAALEPDVTSYHVTGLTPGQNYTFAIQAEDASGMMTEDGPFCAVTAFEVEQVIYKSNFSAGLSEWQLFRYDGGTNSRTANDSDENGSIAIQTDETFGDTLVVADTSETYILRAEAQFPGYIGKCKVEFDAKLANQSLIALADASLYTANANNYMIHLMQNNKSYQVRGGEIVNSDAVFDPNVWRHYEIVLENASDVRGTASVWVDGQLIAENIAFRAGNKGQNLNQIIVGSAYSVAVTPVTQVANVKAVKVGASDWTAMPELQVVDNTENTITVQWEQAGGNPAQYLVFIDGALVDIVDGGVDSYTAEDLEGATPYLFEVRAVDAAGVSSQFSAKREIKTYNPNGFTVQLDGFYLADDTEQRITSFTQGKIRAKLLIENDNSPSSDVTALALLYRKADSAKQLVGMHAVSDLVAAQGEELPVVIDILTSAQANCLEICLIDTITGVMPLSEAFVLE